MLRIKTNIDFKGFVREMFYICGEYYTPKILKRYTKPSNLAGLYYLW